MKQTIPSYMVSLSNNNFEVLEEIFERMYSKFITFYWLLKDYSDSIESLSYKNKSKEYDTLKISITFMDSADVLSIYKDLKQHIGDNDDITITKKKSDICIEIIGAEAGLQLPDDDINDLVEES